MLLAKKSIVPPKEWEHNKFIEDRYNETVAAELSLKCIIPPQHWMITKDENKWIFNHIKYFLRE